MAVPKKRTSKMKKRSRKSNWKQQCIKVKKVAQTFLIKTLIPNSIFLIAVRNSSLQVQIPVFLIWRTRFFMLKKMKKLINYRKKNKHNSSSDTQEKIK